MASSHGLLCDRASRKVRVKAGDIKNAYFQGMKLARILLMRQPRGGIPDHEIKFYGGNHEDNDYLLAQVPIYGTTDAGRAFWKKLRATLDISGCKENMILHALYAYTRNNEIMVMTSGHVDALR